MQATALLASLSGALPAQRPWPEGETNVTAAFLSHVAADPSRLSGNPESFAIERLSRKVDVARAVGEAYDAEWKRKIGDTPLCPEGWPLLAAVFLAKVESGPAESAEALRFLNSAFNALDLADAGDTSQHDQLKTIANEQMLKILAVPNP